MHKEHRIIYMNWGIHTSYKQIWFAANGVHSDKGVIAFRPTAIMMQTMSVPGKQIMYSQE